jgi:hypothetical protein
MTQEIKAKNLYEFIDLTKTRTGMFIGDESLTALHFNINGYLWACDLKGIKEDLEPDFGLFHDFVANYYLYSESTAGWKNMILSQNFGIEKQALKEFYKLFDLFRTNAKIGKAKNILYKLLDRIVNVSNLNDIQSNSSESLTHKLRDLPNQLGNINFAFEYDDILDEIENEAQQDLKFMATLQDIRKDLP